MPKKPKNLAAKQTWIDYVKHSKSKVKRGQSARKRAEKKVLKRILKHDIRNSRSPKAKAVVNSLNILLESYFKCSNKYKKNGAKSFANSRSIRALERKIKKLKDMKKLARELIILQKKLGRDFFGLGLIVETKFMLNLNKGNINEMIFMFEKILKEAKNYRKSS